MIISKNLVPTLDQFDELCRNTQEKLNTYAKSSPDYFLSKGAQKLEPEIKLAMDEASKGTPFDGTIEIVSGHKFPDIVAAKYYGLEVKSTISDQWTTIGGSVAEGTRVADVKHINLIFGKLYKPVEFKVRRYQECLYDIAVTHSPRYKIDMNLEPNKTIFDKMGIEYCEMQKLSEPMTPVVKYFRSTLKEGEALWWVNGDNPEDESVPFKIRLWTTLSSEEKRDFLIQGLSYFPEIFGVTPHKYEHFTLWLVAKHGIVSTSMRDTFTAGGKKDIVVNGKNYRKVPRIYEHVNTYATGISHEILNAEKNLLIETWNIDRIEQKKRIQAWIKLVNEYSKDSISDVAELLNDIFLNKG
jgi:hypothetical protein